MNDTQPERGPEAPGNDGSRRAAAGLPLLLQKINLVTALAALILFFLPWIDIQCSGKSMATQTGMQIIHGGASPERDAEGLVNEKGRGKRNGAVDKESLGSAPLVALAFMAVAGAVVLAFIAIRSAGDSRQNLTGILCAVALGLLALQMMIGFPVKKNLGEQLSAQSKTERRADEPFKELGDGMAQAVMMQIQIRKLPALYIELILLGLPTLILANGLIDRMKRG